MHYNFLTSINGGGRAVVLEGVLNTSWKFNKLIHKIKLVKPFANLMPYSLQNASQVDFHVLVFWKL